MGKDIWVSPREDKWGVHAAGDDHDIKTFDTQKEAAAYGRELAKQERSELIIQGRDGKIRSKDSYGNDPRSRKDTEH